VRLAVAGGATGGHTFPALATIRALRDLTGGRLAILWLGSDRLDRKVAEEEGFLHVALDFYFQRWRPTPSNLPAILRFLGQLITRRPFRQAAEALTRFRPQLILSTGGYVALPTLVVARRLGVPILQLEPNALPGTVTSLFARRAELTVIPPGARPPARRVFELGVPALLPSKEEAEQSFRRYSPSGRPLILFTGGSQGSRQINRLAEKLVPELAGKFSIVIQHGRQEISAGLAELDGVTLIPFEKNLSALLAASSLVISRAGAATLALIEELRLPALLLPLGGRGGHQYHNAARLLRLGHPVRIAAGPEEGEEILVWIDSHLLASPAYQLMELSGGPNRPARQLAELILDLAGSSSQAG